MAPQNYRQSMASDQQSVSSVATGAVTPNTAYHRTSQIYSPQPQPGYANANLYGSADQYPVHTLSSPSTSVRTSSFEPHPPSLTNILLTSAPQPFALATQHPFLRLAGLGTLPKHTLSRWLSQDRLYAQAYIAFIGALIARVELPDGNVVNKQTSLRWRIVKLLSAALENIHRELAFFAATADQYALVLDAPNASGLFGAEPATKQYVDLFRAFGTDPSMTLLEGLVVLWATEVVYLSAWKYAASFETAPASSSSHRTSSPPPPAQGPGSESESGMSAAHSTGPSPHPHSNHGGGDPKHAHDVDGGALRDAFIPNWTSKEFESFVGEIAQLTDQLAEREQAVHRKLDVYKAVWQHVLEVERRFWPEV